MKFKLLLKTKKISQHAVAQQLGVSQQLISRWVMGDCQPQLDKLLKLSEVLEVTIDEIVKSFQK